MEKLTTANLITLAALLMGFISITLLFAGAGNWVQLIFPVILLCDKLDGMVARRFNAVTSIGAQLDSLGDLINFAVLISLFILSRTSHPITTPVADWSVVQLLLVLAACLYVGCAAWRLARFNSEVSSTPGFTGLPSTNAAAWMFILAIGTQWLPPLLENTSLIVLLVLFAALMVARFTYRNTSIFTLLLYPLVPLAAGVGFWLH